MGALERAIEGIPSVLLTEARFVKGNSDGTAQVDFGQGQITVSAASGFLPEPGARVWVAQVNDRTVMLGPANRGPKTGTITATGTLLTVSTANGSEQLPQFIPYSSTVVPTVGDTVVIDRSYGRGVVMGKLSTFPTNNYVAPAVPTASRRTTSDFRATDSGTFYNPTGRWNQNDVWATGTGNNTGAWFYGNTIADTIPDNATIHRVQMYLPEFSNSYPGTPTQLALHSDGAKGIGAPSLGGTTPVGAGRGWKDVPASWGDDLKTGARRGVGTNGATSGLAKYTGRANDADSGLLRIEWSN